MSVRFLDGPAEGVELDLRNVPERLRVVCSDSGKWDALDMPGDEPRANETVYIYQRATAGRITHIDYRASDGRRAAKWLASADYRYVRDLRAVKEYPVIFSAPMVRAALENRKTQTRRLPTSMWANAHMRLGDGEGLRLWVREAWAYRLDRDHMDGQELYDSGVRSAWYWADGSGKCCRTGCAGAAGRVRAARFMPRWASRITLDVVSMRRERLQDISGEDAIAEGIDPEPHRCGCERCCQTSELCPATASGIVLDFWDLWDKLHAKPGTTWADNPEVYRIEFRMVPQP